MTTEWKDLVTLREVAEAQHNGWEFESSHDGAYWSKWEGITWTKRNFYRGRPAQPRMKKVVSECWRNMKTGSVGWAEPMSHAFVADDWKRFPPGDIEGEVEDA
jgi:hypothetical protein